MPKILLKILAFLSLCCLPALAHAQSDRRMVDENGIDLLSGRFIMNETDISIGASTGLRLDRAVSLYDVDSISHNWLVMVATETQNGSGWTVSANGLSKTFHIHQGGNVYTDLEQTGETLTLNTPGDGGALYVDRNGTKFKFLYDSNIYYGTSIEYPSGYKVSLHWKFAQFCTQDIYDSDGNLLEYGTCTNYGRLQSVTDNKGHQLKFSYLSNLSDDPWASYDPGLYYDWARLTSAKAINNAVEYCDPMANSCSLTQSWPTVTYTRTTEAGAPTLLVTQPGNRIWKYKTPAQELAVGSGGQNLAVQRFLIRKPGDADYNHEIKTIVSGTKLAGDHDLTISQGGNSDFYDFVTLYSTASSTRTKTTKTSANGLKSTVEVDHFNPLVGNWRARHAIVRPFKIVDAKGNAWTFSNNPNNGRVNYMVYPEGNVDEYTYDIRSNLTSVTRLPKTGLGSIVRSSGFDVTCSSPAKCNKPNWTKDAKSNQTDFAYDTTTGATSSITMPADSTGVRPKREFQYGNFQAMYKNSAGSLVAGSAIQLLQGETFCNTTASCANTADQSRATFSYGTAGVANNLALSSRTSSAGNGTLIQTESFAYDRFGNQITFDGILNGSADVVRRRFDEADRLVGVVSADPDGGGSRLPVAVRTTYNGNDLVTKVETGNVADHTDGAWLAMTVNDVVDIEYDVSSRKIKETRSTDGIIRQVTQFSYDADNKLICEAVRMNPASFASLPTSACSTTTQGSYGADRITRNHYDPIGRLEKVERAVGTAGAFFDAITSYTRNGKVDSIIDAKGNKTTYLYDGYDRLSQTLLPVTTPGSGTSSANDYEQVEYDLNSNIVQRRLRDGAIIVYSYDNLNRLVLTDLPGAEPNISYAYDLAGRTLSASQGSLTMSFDYDAQGQLESAASPTGSIDYLYDAGRRIRLNWGDGFWVSYEHDVLGNVTHIREQGGLVLANYTYDSLNRRSSIIRGNGTTTNYVYDKLSQITGLTEDLTGTTHDRSLTLAWNPAAQIDQSTSTSANDVYAWNAGVAVNRSYQSNGINQLTQSGSIVPTYDGRGNLTSAGPETYSYNSRNALTSVSNGASLAYDPMGQLYQISNGSGGTVKFAYDGPDLIAEYDGSGLLLRRYVHGPGENEPIVWYEGANTSDRRWLHSDERGSILALSNSTGVALTTNNYDEYGIPGTGNSGRFQYTGQMWLPELGMYHYGARTYSPTLGRFLQPDPIGYGDGLNMYAYVGADPINSVDPSGTTASDIVVTGRRGASAELIAFSNTPRAWAWADIRDQDMERARSDVQDLLLDLGSDFQSYDVAEAEPEFELAQNWTGTRGRGTARWVPRYGPFGLRYHQGQEWRGHTLTEHVGRSPQQLRTRLNREGKKEVSTFSDARIANAALRQAVDGYRDRITGWLVSGHGNRMVVPFKSSIPLGQVLRRGDRMPRDAYEAVFIIQRNDNPFVKADFVIITGWVK